MTTNGHPRPRQSTPLDVLTAVTVGIIVTPALAVPLGFAWRVLRWAAGT